MSKVDDMLKATRLPDLVLNLGKSAITNDGDYKLFFSINEKDGGMEVKFHERDNPRVYVPKEHAMTVASWIIENYGDK